MKSQRSFHLKGIKISRVVEFSVETRITGQDDDAVAVGDEVAARGVAVDQRLAPDADEQEALVAGVDEAEHRHRDPEGEDHGQAEAHQDPAVHVADAAHRDGLIELPSGKLMLRQKVMASKFQSIRNSSFTFLDIFCFTRKIFSEYFRIEPVFSIKVLFLQKKFPHLFDRNQRNRAKFDTFREKTFALSIVSF